MFSEILRFLIDILFTLFGAALLLRAWMHAVRLHPFNPLARTIYQCTNWLILPLRRVVPASNSVDWTSLLAGWLAALVFFIVLAFGALPPADSLPRILLAAVLTEARWALNLVIWLTLIQAVLSWVNPMSPIMPLLQTLSAPILNPIRRILPRTSIDFSPLVVLLLAQVLIMLLTRLSYLA
ncbi:YggT family protein [Bordetella avium]|uniref:Membrane protein n=1 Tax=Bordetella avium (strain 197N) TaxID=360910 RepID=Q2KUX4_BORA1|nr:YggT family protein [Bordetella avium]RIQ55456.1 YggT family protein [Bordetella avium]RIQ73790.1 YggT family protein [Bordetella avium]CAJ50596.1 putative membrane protein [Bordetella avium 197N]